MIETLIGLDFGLKKTGIAVGQTLTKTASPIGILRMNGPEFFPHEFEKILETWRPQALVVGIPLNMDDSDCSVTTAAKAFADYLERFNLPVYRVDERLTTKSAKREHAEMALLHQKKRTKAPVDAFAAVLILESWLENNTLS